MKGLLVRIGVDQAYGAWNAPVHVGTHEFVYVPIPESPGTRFHRGLRRPFRDIRPALDDYRRRIVIDGDGLLTPPAALLKTSMHLDPDFSYLTYGDRGKRRGSRIKELGGGDILVFYAGLRPLEPCEHKLLYALVGLYVVDAVIGVRDIPRTKWGENAHTRKNPHDPDDIVVRARPAVSGRLGRCIPIGEWRHGAYRVRRDLLEAWGGLSVTDGYIQRSAVPPRFLNARRFYEWFRGQNVELIAENNPETKRKVIIVHLRKPRRNNPDEMRSDPFWEFGSFGCTGCHGHNLMHPKRIDELEGARLAFAQGGPAGFRLVMLTPPVRVVRHETRCEVKWTPLDPFRYEAAPLLINNDGGTDFPSLMELIASADRKTMEARFSSRFRSCRTPLPENLAEEIERTYDRAYRSARQGQLASSYEQALPYPPRKIDRDRKRTYEQLLAEASAEGTVGACMMRRITKRAALGKMRDVRKDDC